jgi:hypothetical protein
MPRDRVAKDELRALLGVVYDERDADQGRLRGRHDERDADQGRHRGRLVVLGAIIC